ncbi:bacterial alpha-L-rhamnosidase-domain-containing protein [Fusarium solani]|uniref:alpha-L-rhamnosidase n=1 Tax=Fusarium solani TaxID=169388 RepID=A0A9P9H025_FUSSL|nr:bacterial alpha-L-rhamnosidase-domain-containing protein [Fusarium solani]KAH7248012.1 bacterial alpha-L-rhamnosidase-domain-containing protein [Fusarium solani]
MSSLKVVDVRFEHYRPENTLGVHETKPRISWRFENAPENFTQEEYELQLSKVTRGDAAEVCSVKRTSPDSQLVTWPHEESIQSREIYSIRVRARGKGQSEPTAWSEPATLEAGLFDRKEWSSKLISAPWSDDNNDKPQPADLFRKEFKVDSDVQSARLYITAQGIYEAELNGKRVGDYFLAPGWNCYDSQLNYQTYDVTGLLSSGENCLGVHVAEGWYKGRLGFEGGQRNIWGSRTALQAQLEVQLKDGSTYTVVTDDTWTATQGPIKLAEIYDGEKYDATAEIPGWSSPGVASGDWKAVDILPPISESVALSAGFSEPVRRIETVKPTKIITTPSGKTVLDFGQNLVGYIRIKSIKGPRGHSVTISHAEVMEKEELGIRPLRFASAQDAYTLKGDEKGESYEPRFTFHGFRYAQIDNWPSAEDNLLDILEAVVCNTDMEEQGTFACSDDKLNRLFSNVRWGMRGNFVSIPTDCPQRDERLGWTGDLALFAPTATFVYGCVSILRDWLQDVWSDQRKQKGIPPMVTPNILSYNKFWGNPWPCAIWHDVTVLAPWALWEETADPTVLADQYESMEEWLKCIPRNKTGATHLWDSNSAQLADWLDPTAPPDAPHKAQANPHLVADAFLIRSLDLVARVAEILGRNEDASRYKSEAASARAEFRGEYVTPSGRILSECQTSYCLSICFDLLESHQLARAGERLVDIVRRNGFCVGTGFAGTPFICEALTRTGHSNVAYSMLLNETCPSWLYTISMGATTMWERWDSMLPDGTINPGEMTSFNHYAYGAVAKFMVERLAGLQQLESGWKKTRVQPEIGGEFKWASAQHLTPYGIVSSSWNLKEVEGEKGAFTLQVDVVVPPTTTMEVILPAPEGPKTEVVGSGKWSFSTRYERNYQWPVKAIPSTLPGLAPEE